MTTLAAIVDGGVSGLFFHALRVGAVLACLPTVGTLTVPARVRAALALGAALLIGGAGVGDPLGRGLIADMGLVAGELLIGFGIGFVLHAACAAANVAGELITQQMGLSFFTTAGVTGGFAPLLGNLLVMTLWLLFVSADGHFVLIAVVLKSYALLPPGAPLDDFVARAASLGALSFSAGLLLAAPLVGVLLIANLWLGFVTRSAPSLNLFSIGFPLLMVVGLGGVVLAWPRLVEGLAALVARSESELIGLVGG